jgi:hypothetical protein
MLLSLQAGTGIAELIALEMSKQVRSDVSKEFGLIYQVM